MQNDTIAAIATAMSPSGIGIIRISGDDALSVIDRIYKSKNNKKKISACQSHTIHYGFIYDGDEKIDDEGSQYIHEGGYCGDRLPRWCVCDEKSA